MQIDYEWNRVAQRWEWWLSIVWSEGYLVGGYADTYDQAFRNARNFLKRNQNWIYK